MERHGSDSVKRHEGDFYFNRYCIGKKKVSKKKYQAYRKKLIGKRKNKKLYTYRENTAGTRNIFEVKERRKHHNIDVKIAK